MKTLVAGVGNVLLGDDGFGVEVVRALAGRSLPADVRLADFGIRGLDLTYALLDGYDAAIIVDVACRGGAPGTLYVIAPALGDDVPPAGFEPHAMHPARVLAAVRGMGASPVTVRVVGCEPGKIDEEDLHMGLSDAVAAAVDPAVALVESLLAELRQGRDSAHA
jgi:hydrogenase maturation protease